ncbi:MAG: membrane protein insertase YidC [Clostridia bacterium]|nr:membrane protein insertase YidC [Clostridia bacterium]
MQSLFNIINIPLGYVLKFLSEILGGNFAASVFVFTLLINLILIPLSIKSQKSSVSQMRIKPKLDELKKRYGDDRQKMAQAQQKLYQDEGVSMSGGCLPLIVRMVLLFSIYWLIMSPLTYMAGADKTRVGNVTTAINTSLADLKKSDEEEYNAAVKSLSWKLNASNSYELSLIKIIRDNPDSVKEVLSEKQYSQIESDYKYAIKKYNQADINFNLFGIDLIDKPEFSWDIFNNWEPIWLLPIAAFLAQMLTSVVSMRINKHINPDAPSMAGMMLTMPLISLFIGFSFPGGVCFYWICSSLIGGAIQSAIQILYGPHKLLARDRAKELSKVCDFEAGQRKKLETE